MVIDLTKHLSSKFGYYISKLKKVSQLCVSLYFFFVCFIATYAILKNTALHNSIICHFIEINEITVFKTINKHQNTYRNMALLKIAF